MTQPTRRPQWRAAALVAGLVAGLGAYAGTEAAAAPASVSKPAAPAAKLAAHNPAGAAKSLAALARFAKGQLGDSAYDRRVAAALARFTRGKEIARRIVAPYEAMSAAERAVHFTEVSGLDVLTTRAFDRADYDRWRLALADAAAARAQQVTRTVLAPDPIDPKERSQYELIYRGMKVSKGADADGTDEPVVFTAVFWPGGPADPYRSATRTLPESGTLGVANGASSGASAGEVWSSGYWPGAWNSGIVFLSAVLEDNGDLELRKEELAFLLAFAESEASEDPSPDRMSVLRASWRTRSTCCTSPTPSTGTRGRSRCASSPAPSTSSCTRKRSKASPFPHKLALSHNPRGGDYTLYFDVPTPRVALKTVVVTVKQVEALGAERDRSENRQADFGIDVSVDAHHPGLDVSRLFPRNKNLYKPGWTVERQVQAGSNVAISVRLWDRDPPGAIRLHRERRLELAAVHHLLRRRAGELHARPAERQPMPAFGGACPTPRSTTTSTCYPRPGPAWTSYLQRSIGACSTWAATPSAATSTAPPAPTR
jgi:hypothetical protein